MIVGDKVVPRKGENEERGGDYKKEKQSRSRCSVSAFTFSYLLRQERVDPCFITTHFVFNNNTFSIHGLDPQRTIGKRGNETQGISLI